MIIKNKKIILALIEIPICLFLLVLAFVYGKMKYENYEWNKKTEAFMSTLQAPFKADTYGGKTPEETWALYVAAVKKRDIDLASRYYDVGHQEKEKKFFEEELKIDNLDYYIYQISNPLTVDQNTPSFLASRKDRKYYVYQFKNKKTGKVETFNVSFYLNPLTSVWKILY